MTDELEELEKLEEYHDPEFNKNGSSEIPPSDIVAYNELRSCADLVRMAEDDGVIDLHPEFQRDEVWGNLDQTRFIDSLAKELPIPSMCFAFDYTSAKWIVIDGLQRIATIVRFLKDDDWCLSRDNEIDSRLSGKTVTHFKNGDEDARRIFHRVQNKTLPITVLRCEFLNQMHMEYLYMVFHRLNAGGMKLTNQEIRNCIYNGSFNQLLRNLDKLPSWRKFNKMVDGRNYRFLKQEVILRIFAFAEAPEDYTGLIGKFLNSYMNDRRNEDDKKIDEKRKLFTRTADVVERVFPESPKERIPTAFVEALFVGLMKNIDKVESLDDQTLRERVKTLRAAKPFREDKLSEGLSKKDKVSARLNEALAIFAK